MGNFIAPREMYFGPGSLEQIKTVKGKKAIIVTGEHSMRESGTISRVSNFLKEVDIESVYFNGVESDPSLDTVKKGAKVMLKEQPDLIIGLGGCSAIDAAKAMWVFYEHPETKFEDIIAPFSIKELGKKAKFIAIPSTSGTGTEVTCASVITDRSKNLKHPLVSHELVPHLAIVDGEICATMPSHVTAHTGMDALSHNIEAYVSALNNPYSDAMTEKSVSIIFKNIETAVAEPENIEARQAMHNASCLAGYSFSNALLGIIHAMAHQMGGTFGVPHGCANAILSANVVRYNSKSTDRYDELAKIVGVKGAEEFACAIEELNVKINIQASFKEYGVDEKEFYKNLDTLVANAMKDPCVGCNPRVPELSDIKNIFIACFEGERVDF